MSPHLARSTRPPYSRAQMDPRLAHIRTWIFDLDNTLYPASARLFDQIDAKMTAYLAQRLNVDLAEAHRIQKGYFHSYGTTLAGMMADHTVDPHEFLAFVHDVEMDVLEENAPLAAAIARLPGRKIVFTNADTPYASKVLGRLGLGASFEAIHDVHAMGLVPKPQASAYAGLCAALDIDPKLSLFAEDMVRNLKPAKDIGMTTLWIDNGSEQTPDETRRAVYAHVDFTTHDVSHWLHTILEA
jgi:putative hydrolase of the HAD superfamily